MHAQNKSNTALLIPCFNAVDGIEALLKQADKQTLAFDEVICYDDASTDNTASIVRDCGVRLISGKENAGPGFARNKLIEAARCDFIHFHDADDPFLSEFFVERVSAYADKDTAAFCAWSRIDTNNESKVYEYDQWTVDADWSSVWIQNHIHLNAVVYPREFLVKNGGFNPEFRTQQDLHLNMKMSREGLKYKYVDELLATHVRNDASHTSNVSMVRFHTTGLRLVQDLFSGYSYRYHQVLYNKYSYHLKALLSVREYDVATPFIGFLKRFRNIKVSGGKMEQILARLLGPETVFTYILWKSRKQKSR